MNLQSLEVTDYVYFKKASIDFSKPGITLILANNKDAGLNSTNGAGKSLLLGAIPKAILDESPTGKDAKPTKDEKITLVFKNKTDTYKVVWTNGKNKSIDIFKNLESIENRTLAYSKSFVKKLTGSMSPETFYTQVYLDSTIPHPLLFPNAKVRQDFFVNLFGINDADSIRKLLLSQYRECQEGVSKHKELKTLIEEDFKDNIAELKELLDTLSSKQKTLIESLSLASSKNDLIRFRKKNKDLIDVWNSVKAKNLQDSIKSLRKSIRVQETAKTDQATLDLYNDALIKVKEDNKKTQILIDELNVSEELEQEEIEAYSERFLKAQDSITFIKNDISKIKIIRVSEAVQKPKNIDSELDLEKLLTLKEDELSHLLEFKKGKCPTCGQSVKQISSKEDLEEEIITIKNKLEKIRAYIGFIEKDQQYKAQKAELEELEENLALATKKVNKYSKYYKLTSLNSKLVEYPKKPEVNSSVKFETKLLEELKVQLEKFVRLSQVLDKVKECLDIKDLELTDTEKLAEALANVNEKIGVTSSEIARKEEIKKTRKRISTKIEALNRNIEDEKIIKVLVDAYSKRGIKKVLINNYAKLLETQVNKFSKLFYTEDYVFEFSFDTKLNLLVTRKHGNRVKTSDVAKLSGAEKRAFTLVLLMSTITFLPKNKRSNILILDEPESNLGPQALENFVKSLPVLNKLVPHIVILTPRQDLEIPNSSVFTVVKQAGVSTLKKGRLC